MNKLYASMICGFTAGVVVVLPFPTFMYYFLLIPAASYFTLKLNQKVFNDYSRIIDNTAIRNGFITAVFMIISATFFDTLMSFIIRANEFTKIYPYVIEQDPQYQTLLKDMYDHISTQLKETGFSFEYTAFMFILRSIFYPIFGILGAVVSMRLINKKNREREQE